MTSPRHLGNWAEPGYDIAFLQNACVMWYSWQTDDATVQDTDETILGGFASLCALWSPLRCPVLLRPIAYDATTDEHLAVTAQAGTAADTVIAATRVALQRRRATEPKADWGLDSIGPTPEGWIRVAIPAGATAEDAWTLASDDGIISKDYSVEPAPDVEGLPTVWIRVYDVGASSDVSLSRVAPGHAEARLTLGATVFSPAAEPRTADALIRGVSVADWQAVNARLIQATERALAATGWQAGRA